MWPSGASPDALAFKETDAWAGEWYFRNLSYLNGFWTLCAPQETFPLLKCVFFFSAGISHSSEVWRRTGGEAKAEGPNHILSLGELEQRRRPGI